MLYRMMLLSIKPLVLGFGLLASGASAQTQNSINVFFGFEYVLEPIAIKWTCGGQPDHELSQLNALMNAFPEDAQSADVQNIVAALLKNSKRSTGLSELLGGKLSKKGVEKICASALRLNIDWLTPEQMSDSSEADIPRQQKDAWEAFYKTMEAFYKTTEGLQ